MHERPWNRESRAWNAWWFCARRMNRIRQGSKIHSSPHSTHSFKACQYAVCTLPCMLLRKTQPRWFANQTNAWFKKRKITVYIQCNFVQLVLLWVGLLSYLKHNVLFEIAFTRLPLLLEWLYLLFKIISMWKQTHLNFMFHILISQICHISYLINNTMFKRNNHWEMHHYLGFLSKKSYKYHMSITAGACTCSSCIHYEV